MRKAARILTQPPRPTVQCLRGASRVRRKSDAMARWNAKKGHDNRMTTVINPLQDPNRFKPFEPEPVHRAPRPPQRSSPKRGAEEDIDYALESTHSLYSFLRSAAIDGETQRCSFIAEMLVGEREEKPNLQIYNAMIWSNVSHDHGAAWRVRELLDHLTEDGLQPDSGTCHAVLKVLSVHVDHLLRADVMEYMSKRWFNLSEDGAHDIAAGLFREGLFEQGLERIDLMRQQGMHVHGWLLDMAVYVLCEANEVAEAYRIMRQRFDAGEMHLSRSMWSFFLDKASEARHHPGTSLAWSSQVVQKYINPSSGICLNVLATAAQAADAVMATEVFTHLSKRGTAFQPIHYELLISTYLSADPPDLKRATSILTIMPLEKLEPDRNETRALYLHLHDKPAVLPEVMATLRDLHEKNRKIPIAALNLLIECYVKQNNLSEALKLYKQIHTFAPITDGAAKTFANIETFNLLLRGCCYADPPDAHQASFLVNELLALRIQPTALTYDRLILVFVNASVHARNASSELADENQEASAAEKQKSAELIDWAFRHLVEMQEVGWLPRFGTVELLAVELARCGDERCWDVMQIASDSPEKVDGWAAKRHFVQRNVEDVWSKRNEEQEIGEGVPGEEKEGVAIAV